MAEQEVQVEQTATQNEQEQPATVAQVDVDKLVQSERSKAKNEILKAIGVENVDAARSKFAKLDELTAKNQELEKQRGEIEQQKANIEKDFKQYKKRVLYSDLGISEDSQADFDALVNSKVDDTHSYEDVAREVANKYFSQKPRTGADTDQRTPPARINTFGW